MPSASEAVWAGHLPHHSCEICSGKASGGPHPRTQHLAFFTALLWDFEVITSFPYLFAFSAVERLGFWEDVRRIISQSELITGFPYSFTAPGLPQYLQSLTKLAIATVWAVAAQAGEQAEAIPISFSQLLESSFPEVRLLTLDALLERFSTAGSGLGEKGLPPLLCNMGGTFLTLAMKEKHPECFCKVKGSGPSPSTPHTLWQADSSKIT